MSKSYFFDYCGRAPSAPEASHRICVAFTGIGGFNLNMFRDEVRAHMRDRLIPDIFLVVMPNSTWQSLGEVNLFSRKTSIAFTAIAKSITPISLNSAGELTLIGDPGRISPETDLCLDSIWQHGLINLVDSNGALLGPSPTHHFVKPSGKHCPVFLRTANVCSRWPEICFVAASLLSVVPETTKSIYCDSLSISPIVSAMFVLRKIEDPETTLPHIENFSSYSGSHKLNSSDKTDQVALISSSTSCDLAKTLIHDKNFSPKSVVTLFYLGKSETQGHIHCNLTGKQQPHTGGVWEAFPSSLPSECDLCRNESSVPIRLQGDQFLPEQTDVETVDIRAEDSPLWLPKYMDNYHGKRVIRAHFDPDPDRQQPRSIYIHLSTLVDSGADEPFGRKLKHIADTGLPANTSRVVHIGDADSKRLASGLLDHFPSNSQATLYSARDLDEISDWNTGCTVVIASGIITGRQLTNLSRRLREFHKDNDRIVYVVGLDRCPDNDRCRSIRSNLTWGFFGRSARPIYFIDSIRIPGSIDDRVSPWQTEIDLWEKVIEHDPSSNHVQALEERKSAIQAAASSNERGLVDNLFLDVNGKHDGEEMKLQAGFAFFRTESSETSSLWPSQADVFFTITAVLHNLRHQPSAAHSLRQTPYRRKVISPLMFDRFNDAVVQASILRAAYAAELDYALSPNESHHMAEIILMKIERKEQHSALAEYFLAIACYKLTLLDDDLDRILKAAMDVEVSPFIKMLATYISQKFESRSRVPI